MSPADKQPEQQQDAAAAPGAELQRASSKREAPVDGAEVQGREQALRRDRPPSFKVSESAGTAPPLAAGRRAAGSWLSVAVFLVLLPNAPAVCLIALGGRLLCLRSSHRASA